HQLAPTNWPSMNRCTFPSAATVSFGGSRVKRESSGAAGRWKSGPTAHPPMKSKGTKRATSGGFTSLSSNVNVDQLAGKHLRARRWLKSEDDGQDAKVDLLLPLIGELNLGRHVGLHPDEL